MTSRRHNYILVLAKRREINLNAYLCTTRYYFVESEKDTGERTKLKFWYENEIAPCFFYHDPPSCNKSKGWIGKRRCRLPSWMIYIETELHCREIMHSFWAWMRLTLFSKDICAVNDISKEYHLSLCEKLVLLIESQITAHNIFNSGIFCES